MQRTPSRLAVGADHWSHQFIGPEYGILFFLNRQPAELAVHRHGRLAILADRSPPPCQPEVTVGICTLAAFGFGHRLIAINDPLFQPAMARWRQKEAETEYRSNDERDQQLPFPTQRFAGHGSILRSTPAH